MILRFVKVFALVASVCACLSTVSVGQVPPSSGPYVEGEVLVKFRTTTTRSRAAQSVAGKGHEVARQYRWLSERRGQSYMLVRSKTKSTAELLAELQQDPNVEYVGPNHLRRLYGSTFPADPSFVELWGLHNTGQVVNGSTGTSDVDIDFPEAWGMSRVHDTQTVIAVIDTGVDYTHPDLVDNMWTNPGEIPTNNVDDDNNGYIDDYYGYDFAGDGGNPPDSDPADIADHGTHVAGTAAARGNNGEGVVGVNFRAEIMSLKASDDGTFIDEASGLEAIQYAAMMKTSGVNVVAINASYGGPSFSTIERDAIAELGDLGIIMCAAAGNDGQDNDDENHFPSDYPLSNIIAVAATDQDDNLAGFSNFGSNSVDIAAPGVHTFSTLPVHFATTASVVSVPFTYEADGMNFAGVTSGITRTMHGSGLGFPTSFNAAVSGNIALIQRGSTEFTAKSSNAMVAGAVGVIIYNTNNAQGNFMGTLQFPSDWVPVVSVSYSNGLDLLAMGTTSVTIVNEADPDNAYQFLEGTSMATPHVAGAVAMLSFNYPNEHVTSRVARILSTVDPATSLVGKVVSEGRLNLRRAMDTDEDTLPDWWEVEVSGVLTSMTASSDFDGDGFLDGQEFEAGTHAGVSSSFLNVTAETNSVGEGMVIRWPSSTNKLYSILRATNLLDGFSVLASNIPSTPVQNVYTDTTVTTESSLFYAIELE